MRFLIPFLTSLLAIGGSVNSACFKADGSGSADLAQARAFFNSELLGILDQASKGQNMLVSPYGLHSLYSALMTGAQDKTYDQLFGTKDANGLGYKLTKLNRKTMLDVQRESFLNATDLNASGLDFASLLAVEENLPMNQQFRDEVGKAFGMSVLTEDFALQPERATKELNDWVKIITRNDFVQFFDKQLQGYTGLLLMSALRLNADWISQFDPKKTYDGNFNLGDGTTKTVKYMTMSGVKVLFQQFFIYSVISIPLDTTGRLYFSIILPDTVQNTLGCCTVSTDINFSGMSERLVDLTLPTFSITQTLSSDQLISALNQVGVKDVFDKNVANLDGIDNAQTQQLFVSEIHHKAHLEINEKGIQASQADAINIPRLRTTENRNKRSIDGKANAIPVDVNRPFVFVVSDRGSANANWFTGLVYDP